MAENTAFNVRQYGLKADPADVLEAVMETVREIERTARSALNGGGDG
jgi:hypothetical protein